MRDMKFRVWDGEKMHYNVVPWRWDFVISLSWHKCEKSTGEGFLGSGGKSGEFLVPGIAFKKLMQSTGLNDSKQKEIYEGDELMYKEEMFVIQWDDKGCMFVANPTDKMGRQNLLSPSFYHKAKIVGNIYENPKTIA